MAEYSKEEIVRIEEKWRATWREKQVYKTHNDPSRPKYYVLDMFPYPSGAGLHVGHPLGYIASDIVARFKRIKGFNVLHPMGFDAFGLPAEQYAIEHGIHPAVSTQQNIENFKRQLGRIGFCYDWSREVQTCDPSYYRWTQWIFLQIFDSWYNRKAAKAERIAALIATFEKEGNANHPFPNTKFRTPAGSETFTAQEWKSYPEKTRQEILMNYRLAYLAYTDVNWCEALGTVLANDEVINGVSYRGGFPVVKRQMRQWSLRITEYAERLLQGLDVIDFSESMKEIQRNWIGKSIGALVKFSIKGNDGVLEVFTTRPDTIYGVDFMVLAPEHPLVKQVTTPGQKEEMDKYLRYVESRSEIDRMAEVKKVTGCFTGAYAINPMSGREVPIWASEYVLAGYGTGAIMGVPCGDDRDHKFAKHFALPITNILGDAYNGEIANPSYDAVLHNSGPYNGMIMREALEAIVEELERKGTGKRQVNYKMRDAGWSRQRYWGEPFPVVFRDDIPYAMEDKDLPLTLPDSDNFKPSGTGEGPLANLKSWIDFAPGQKRDSNTMPTHAGAAWYFLRYMDPNNAKAFASREALDYWNQVDVYIGGSEHAVAHLLYSRLWVKILHDLGYLNFDEPFRKLINQGKITGESRFVYRCFTSTGGIKSPASQAELISPALVPPVFISYNIMSRFSSGTATAKDVMYLDRLELELTNKIRSTSKEEFGYVRIHRDTFQKMHVDVNLYSSENGLDLELFKSWRSDFKNAEFILDEGQYICGGAIEKMSKTYHNVVNPDDIIDKYGADTLRMYEMFLGPLEASKPWSTNGIDGVYKFLRRFWNLFHDAAGNFSVSNEQATRDELRVLHKTLKKVEHDIENFSFNTSVSEFMICANELTSQKCNKRSVLEPLVIALSPFAPHISEELWSLLGNTDTVLNARFPAYDEQYIKVNAHAYPISINGKVRATMEFALDMPTVDIEKQVLASEVVKKWSEGKAPKKVIIVPGRIVNIVL